MFDLNSLFEFSRNYCLTICAFLVPANMVATLQTIIFVGLRSRIRSPKLAPIILMSTIYALAMILHVYTWFVVGMVMAPTFILLSLGIVCLGINIWAIASPRIMGNFLVKIWQFGMAKVSPKLATELTSTAITE